MINTIVCSAKFQQIFAEIHSVVLPILFLQNFFPLKYVKSSWEAGRDVFRTQLDRLGFFASSFRCLWAINYFCKSSISNVLLGFDYAFVIFSLSWLKWVATALMIKSSNWFNGQNGLCSRGMQIRHFLQNTYKYFNMEVR